MSSRREVMKQGVVVAGLLAAAGYPQYARAYNQGAFQAATLPLALQAVGAAALVESDQVSLGAPDVAENGAVVALSVGTSLLQVRALLLLAERNPVPLLAMFHLSGFVEPSFKLPAKLAQSTNVYAVALANNGQAHYTKRFVQVIVGGCGD